MVPGGERPGSGTGLQHQTETPACTTDTGRQHQTLGVPRPPPAPQCSPSAVPLQTAPLPKNVLSGMGAGNLTGEFARASGCAPQLGQEKEIGDVSEPPGTGTQSNSTPGKETLGAARQDGHCHGTPMCVDTHPARHGGSGGRVTPRLVAFGTGAAAAELAAAQPSRWQRAEGHAARPLQEEGGKNGHGHRHGASSAGGTLWAPRGRLEHGAAAGERLPRKGGHPQHPPGHLNEPRLLSEPHSLVSAPKSHPS